MHAPLLLLAQFLIPDPARISLLMDEVFQPSRKKDLNCSIEPASPRLGFSFIHWSGFGIAVPIRQFPLADVKQTDFAVAIEIHPKGGKATYFGERFSVPPAPAGRFYPKDTQIQYGGGYQLGPGEYNIRAYVADNDGRACRKAWSLKIKDDAKIQTKLEPNQVTAVGGERWRGLDATQEPKRVAVIIDAAPLFPRRNMVRLSSYDRSILITSLTSILDNARFTAATVIAADSRNRKVVYSSNEFNGRGLGRLGRALAEINLGVVSVETLKGPGPAAFLESMLKEHQEAIAKADVVVFLGPAWGWQGGMTPLLRELAKSFPPMHQLSLSRFPAPADNLLASFAKAGNGRTQLVVTPNDLAKAIEKMTKLPK